jgi:hypothetical protein
MMKEDGKKRGWFLVGLEDFGFQMEEISRI